MARASSTEVAANSHSTAVGGLEVGLLVAESSLTSLPTNILVERKTGTCRRRVDNKRITLEITASHNAHRFRARVKERVEQEEVE